MVIMQLISFFSVFLCAYALLTLNTYLLTALLIIMVLQFPIGRIEMLVNLIKKYNHPAFYFSSFEVK